MGGMGGGGGMGTLQALLSEMSGLKKPRGFINRYVRRLLGMKPKPPPKYRILHIFATNMPQSLDEAHAPARPHRPDLQGRLPVEGGPQVRTYEDYLAKVKHELTPADIDKLATITPYATGATIKDMVNEALVIAIRDGRDTINWADVTRAKQLKEHGPPDDSRVHRAGAPRGGDPRGVPRRRRLPHPPAHDDRHGHDRDAAATSAASCRRSRPRTSSCSGARSARPTSS